MAFVWVVLLYVCKVAQNFFQDVPFFVWWAQIGEHTVMRKNSTAKVIRPPLRGVTLADCPAAILSVSLDPFST